MQDLNGKKRDDISVYINEQEYIANSYVMKCFSVTMLVYTATFLLDLLGIFVVDQKLMWQSYVPSLIIYLVVYFISKSMLASSKKTKYFILFSIILVFTIIGVFITYHVVLVSLLPFLYATIYSSKRVMRYVYALTVISTIVVVYGGYFYGLCDANMAVLTTSTLQNHTANGQFALTEINANPYFTLMLFYVIPRCLIYIAFGVVCRRIFSIISNSVEKAKRADEIEKARIEAENANRAKSQFVARISHEIRTPINAVIGMNEMILRESKEENIQRYSRDVHDSSVMLLNIINELLDSSKIESGKMEIVSVNYKIGNLLHDLHNMIRIKAKEKGLELLFDIDPALSKEYYGDDKHIKQILINLLSNAVKYTNQGTVILKVTCRREGENAVLHFAVKDTGIGIKEEDIEKLYDAFQRVDVTRNRNVEGSGLGMNIVQQLLELLGSELQIQSEYEKGSEFSFDIVQKIVDAEPLGDFQENYLGNYKAENSRINYIAPDAKVLVVDDNEMNLRVFQALLKQTRIQIHMATSGMACIDMVNNQAYDLIFLDHMMPEMDGVQTFHAIRNNKMCEGVPIIMLTANAISGDRERYLSEGFDDFLSKPIIPDKLDRMLLQHLPKKYITVINTDESADNADDKVMVKEVSENMTALDGLRQRLPELDYEKALAICSQDENFYLELFKDFTELQIKKELTGYMSDKDYKNYSIRVHGFKNNAYSVGATDLGDLAYELEKLTKSNSTDGIHTLQTRLFEQYDSICLRYKEVTGSDN
ncbi:MAG: response regulator [Lachnospiraceae bacterium]|nr:response regulator [Lachnospiraceae bacterium]